VIVIALNIISENYGKNATANSFALVNLKANKRLHQYFWGS